MTRHDYQDWDLLVPGDVAAKKQTGVCMTVKASIGDHLVDVVWFDADAKLQERMFPRDEVYLDNMHDVPSRQPIPNRYYMELKHVSRGLRHMPELYPTFQHSVSLDFRKFRQYGEWRDHMDFFEDLTERFMMLRFRREEQTVFFFENSTEAVHFKLLIS